MNLLGKILESLTSLGFIVLNIVCRLISLAQSLTSLGLIVQEYRLCRLGFLGKFDGKAKAGWRSLGLSLHFPQTLQCLTLQKALSNSCLLSRAYILLTCPWIGLIDNLLSASELRHLTLIEYEGTVTFLGVCPWEDLNLTTTLLEQGTEQMSVYLSMSLTEIIPSVSMDIQLVISALLLYNINNLLWKHYS